MILPILSAEQLVRLHAIREAMMKLDAITLASLQPGPDRDNAQAALSQTMQTIQRAIQDEQPAGAFSTD
jgi:hypothetical protein